MDNSWMRFKYLILAGLIMAPSLFAGESEPVRSKHVEVQLVSEVRAISPGVPFWTAVRMNHDPHWHTYWINPADSGLETMISWDLPAGFEAGEIHWPYPERLEMGPLVTFGFERDVLLMVEITPPETLDPESSVTLKARVDWLECKEVCLPGDAELVMTLPVTDATPPINDTWSEAFATARAEWPIQDPTWTFSAVIEPGRYVVTVHPPESLEAHDIDHAEFFILDPELVQYAPPQNWRRVQDGYAFDLLPDDSFGHEAERLRGVLVSSAGWRGPGSEKALYVDVEVTRSGALTSSDDEVPGLALALLFAFVGGLILNLMPCVFPVISIKVMGFVRQAEEARSDVWKHGVVFAFGVLASFWVLAGLLIALRTGGDQLGWGFHLQSPVFLIGMSVLFFLLALNLFGVFEIGTSWMGLGQKTTSSSTWTGSFFSGALATVIATPCTAPFMGVALGYALTLSAPEALLVFTFLGLGMAAPYVWLSASPGWLSRIPKPGPWMESLKQGMGWLLAATVLWLAWVLNIMAGGEAVITLMGVLFVVALGAWILGRWGALHRAKATRLTAKIMAAVLIFGGLLSGIATANRLAPAEGGAATSTSGMAWETFTPEKFEALRAEGKPVFINFTAAWCLSCQVNERVAFSSRRVQEAFQAKGITPLKADWTNRDDIIGRVLAGYGRSSVPFYVLYGEGTNAAPVTLPEILTPAIVLDALEQI